MTKINPQLQAKPIALSFASQSSPGPASHLIVLVPDDEDYTAATRRIWELANANYASVQFLGLCKDVEDEPSMRRRLATMSALLKDGKVSAEAKVKIGTNWVDFVKRNYQTGDMIVCFPEQRAGLFHRPLSQILESNLSAPVYILSGLYPQSASRSNWLSQIIVWTGSFAILAGCFWLQIRISQLPKDPAQTLLLILSVGVEFWLIWVWNSLFS